jgi:PII-like signaling protein
VLNLNSKAMILTGESKKLKIITGERDVVYRRPLYEAILFAAKKYKIAGATVHRGLISYGADSLINHVKVFSISDERPVVIELIDREERISDFSEIAVRLLKKAGSGGIIYIENVNVVSYAHSEISVEN